MKKTLFHYAFIALIGLTMASCSDDDAENDEYTQESSKPSGNASGVDFYVLNEGGWGKNNSTLDYFDRTSSTYHANVFSAINPEVTLGLGDTGNDLKIYDGKLYAVMNGSGLVEVMEANTGRHLGSVAISGCRNITFEDGYAYVSSYASADGSSSNGSVWKINTSTLNVEGKCSVGRQPEELVAEDGKLYVCNSGGYMQPTYEKHLSVIDLNSFQEVGRIDIADNINRIVENDDKLYIASQGDYYSQHPTLHIYDLKAGKITGKLDVAASKLWLEDDMLYILGTNYINYTQTLACYNTETSQLNSSPIAAGILSEITAPYSIAVHPESKQILITDAKDFEALGEIFCISADGQNLLWRQSTGIMPGYIAFL